VTWPTFRPRTVLQETGVRAVAVIHNLYRLQCGGILVPRNRLFLGSPDTSLLNSLVLGLLVVNGYRSGEPERMIDAY
jgi:hypothetical protein